MIKELFKISCDRCDCNETIYGTRKHVEELWQLCGWVKNEGQHFHSKECMEEYRDKKYKAKGLTLDTYILPAFWADYLINNNSDNLTEKAIEKIDTYIRDNNLPLPIGTGDKTWFAYHNDANDMSGNVMAYSFLIKNETRRI